MVACPIRWSPVLRTAAEGGPPDAITGSCTARRISRTILIGYSLEDILATVLYSGNDPSWRHSTDGH